MFKAPNPHSRRKPFVGTTVIEKFFDWVDPYVHAAEREFLGYSLYEEGDSPKLHFKL